MSVNELSRIFIDVASKLTILGNAKRLERTVMTISELKARSEEKKDEGACLLFKPQNVGGYVLACDGKVIAIAITNPPKLGEKALEAVDDNPMPGDLYSVEKGVVKRAILIMNATERASKAGTELANAILTIKNKLSERKIEEMLKSEESESLIEKLGVHELEIFDLIDTITLTDEIAYYLEKKGYTVSAETPEELNGHYIATIKIEDDVSPHKLLNDLLEVAEKCDARSVIKVILNDKVYYVDPVLFKTLKKLFNRIGTEMKYSYILPKKGEAELHVVLTSDATIVNMVKIIDWISKLVKKRKLMWPHVSIVVETPTSVYRSS